jgi:hypothetical protein
VSPNILNKRKFLNDPAAWFHHLPGDLFFDILEHRYFSVCGDQAKGLTHWSIRAPAYSFLHALGPCTYAASHQVLVNME